MLETAHLFRSVQIIQAVQMVLALLIAAAGTLLAARAGRARHEQ